MDAQPSRVERPSAQTLSRLLPLADRVEALTRRSGHAFVARDVGLARALIAEDGEIRELALALEAAWHDVLAKAGALPGDVSASVDLVHSLQRISELAGTICGHVVGLSGDERNTHPAIERLAEMVPDLLRDALGAFRNNDAGDAAEVRKTSVEVDVCFAQSYLDLMQVVRPPGAAFETAQHLHGVSRALERIGDSASEIADSVRPSGRA